MGYFIHTAILWQMEFNSFPFFCKACYDYTIDRNWKVDDFITFRSSFCYSFAECAKILEGFPQDRGSKTYYDKNNITANIVFLYVTHNKYSHWISNSLYVFTGIINYLANHFSREFLLFSWTRNSPNYKLIDQSPLLTWTRNSPIYETRKIIAIAQLDKKFSHLRDPQILNRVDKISKSGSNLSYCNPDPKPTHCLSEIPLTTILPFVTRSLELSLSLKLFNKKLYAFLVCAMPVSYKTVTLP